MSYYANKVVLVTGAAGGIGAAIARDLVTEGATVYLADIKLAAAQKVAKKLAGLHGIAIAVKLDVTKPTPFGTVVNNIVKKQGRIDLIFNNAGIAAGGDFEDLPMKSWQRTIDINQMGVIYGSHHAYKHMVKQGSGQIVNIASMYGLYPTVGATPYTATKFAVTAFSQALRVEAKEHGVRVNVVCPGFVESGLFKAGEYVNVKGKDIKSLIPFKLISADKASEVILAGVQKNKSLIVFPFYAKLFTMIYRISPRLMELVNGAALKRMRGELAKVNQ